MMFRSAVKESFNMLLNYRNTYRDALKLEEQVWTQVADWRTISSCPTLNLFFCAGTPRRGCQEVC